MLRITYKDKKSSSARINDNKVRLCISSNFRRELLAKHISTLLSRCLAHERLPSLIQRDVLEYVYTHEPAHLIERNHTQRYYPINQRLKEILTKEDLGTIFPIRSTFGHSGPLTWSPRAIWLLADRGHRRFRQSVVGQKENPVPGEEGYRSLEVCLAIESSIRSGRIIRLPLQSCGADTGVVGGSG